MKLNMKTCTVCRKEKTIESFGLDKKMQDGRNIRCKACANIYADYYRKLPKTVPLEEAKRLTRKCSECGETKILTEFFKKASEPLGYRHKCKKCSYVERRRTLTPADTRRHNLKRKFSLSEKDYDEILEEQLDKCAICRSSDPRSKHNVFAVDHDHKTGMVRGLLCNPCNLALGATQDNIRTLKEMISYLEYNSSTNTQQEKTS